MQLSAYAHPSEIKIFFSIPILDMLFNQISNYISRFLINVRISNAFQAFLPMIFSSSGQFPVNPCRVVRSVFLSGSRSPGFIPSERSSKKGLSG